MTEGEKELKEMTDTLNENAQEMQHLKEYQRIRAIVTQLLELTASTPIFIALIEEELSKYREKEKQ